MYRVPHAQVVDGLFPALEAARKDGSLAPLEPFVSHEHLDSDRHILTGRKYLLFGAEQRELIGVAQLVGRALAHMAAESASMGEAAERVCELIRAHVESGPLRDSLPLWEAIEGYDHNLPEWMCGEEGPSLIDPDEVDRLRAVLPELMNHEEVTSNAELADALRALAALLSRCEGIEGSGYRDGSRWGLAVRRAAGDASAT